MVQQPALQGAAPYGRLPQEQLLLAMPESSEDAIIAHTLDGIIRAWNKGAADMYG
jgi:PAS domain S-box-containing protein